MGRKRKKRDPESQMTFDFGTYLSAEGGEVKGRDTRGQGSQKPVKRELEPADREDLMEKVADLGNLVRAWKRVKANKGAGPLSPLLANIVLDELDKELERRGHRFCRYADDCNIYVRSRKAGERVMEGVTRFITGKLRLKVNETKSKVTPSRDITLHAHWQCRSSFGEGTGWEQQVDGSWKSNSTADGESNSLSMAVSGSGTIAFRWKTSCEGYFNFKGMLIRQDGLSLIVDGEERTFTNGVMSAWAECSLAVEGEGRHNLVWAYVKDSSGLEGADCAWLDSVVWTPNTVAGIVIKADGATVDFEAAEDGKTRTAAVAEGTTAEDVKVFVGGVDVTAGFKVAVEGTTASVVLREPFERTDDAAVSSKPPYHENEDGKTVTLNVEVVPGLYYAADSAATLEALKRPGAAEPAKAGDAVVAPKQTGEQGFYKVWVSDAPIEAE